MEYCSVFDMYLPISFGLFYILSRKAIYPCVILLCDLTIAFTSFGPDNQVNAIAHC
jgi:hypothetical protein